jgi:hypothetical protein
MTPEMCSTSNSMTHLEPMYTQNHRLRLAAGQSEKDAEIRRAFLAIPATLRQRPEPKHLWDNVARRECPSAPWRFIQRPTRIAVRAGAPLESVVDFYVTLLMDALSAAQRPIAFDRTTAVLRAIRENADALEWQATAHASRCPSDEQRMVRESEEAAAANHLLVAMVRRQTAGRVG